MAESFESYFFGPLDKKYCSLFYYISIYFFLLTIIVVLGGVYLTLFSKKVEPAFIMSFVFVALGYGVMYFALRLQHSMCVNSLK